MSRWDDYIDAYRREPAAAARGRQDSTVCLYTAQAIPPHPYPAHTVAWYAYNWGWNTAPDEIP